MAQSRLIPVQHLPSGNGQSATRDGDERPREYYQHLEEGDILYFAESPFDLADDTRTFLLSQRQSGAGYHKNIAYRPSQDRLTGLAKRGRGENERLHEIMRTYSQRLTQFLSELLPRYAEKWRLDFASFRPQEERGRRLRLRARNDLLHIDAFPTRPTNGDRILRIFTNLNPTAPRIWLTSETFESLARRFIGSARLRLPTRHPASPGRRLGRLLGQFARSIGLRTVDRPPYDEFMLRFHHYLKENREFQESCPKQRWEFPPHSTWLLFTDMVSHAVLAGQFALEHTFIVPRNALLLPDKAPVSILESLCGSSLTNA
ncbi:MAG TPA: Kdo hydroxylase family protein [Anaerolineales bacterium]|nr:Kdo hydroxylase family protein [Anaerolineales bacterium]